MKLLPIQLAPVPPGNARNSETPLHSSSSSNTAATLLGQSVTGNGNNMDQHRLPFLSHSEVMWGRYPAALAAFSLTPSPHPAIEIQNLLPNNLACDPRLWNKEDVLTFFRWCETEFDLPHFDIDLFQMNGKALCLLTKQDLGERCPGAGDLIYNVLRWLMKDSCNGTGQHLQMSRSPLTPHFPITPSWCLPIPPQDYQHTSSTPTTLHNSVTLSPAPSVDSQSSSPKQSDQPTSSAFSVLSNGKCETYRNGNTNGAINYSNDDSDGEDAADTDPSPSSIPLATSTSSPPYSPRAMSKSSSGQIFFPASENAEPNTTNGRLLWDFLQQLLNDSLQRYSNYITWKNRDSGIFKITDPPGLAKLWGIQKNHLSMNYDKMSRALRYYYRVNILRKVQGERHCYQFLRNPTELKSIKNISLLRQQMSPSLHPVKVKPEPEAMDENMNEDIGPTDLSLRSPSSPIKTENGADCFQYPQDLSISPVQLQVNMEAREAYSRHSDGLSSSASNAVSSQTQIKIEDTS